MSGHTPTPWEYIKSTLRDENDNGIFDIRSTPFNEETGFIVAETVGGLDDGEEEANAIHIVKCVNAHDDLIEALKAIVENASWMGIDADDIYLKQAKEVLKKVGAE